MKKGKLTLALFTAAMLILALCSCGKEAAMGYTSEEPLTLSDTDYANADNWISFGGDGSKAVDVFIVYPTVTFSLEESDLPYVRLDNVEMRTLASLWLARDGTAFAESCNVYAPYYRQLNAAMLADLTSDEFESYTKGLPREDVFAAFDYFLKNINKGERPFILAGHSQGGQLVGDVATLLLGNKAYCEYNKGHIATYAIGYSLTQGDIDQNPNLHFSLSPTDTGAIVSWNSTAPSEIASGSYQNFGTWKEGALVTNPITWSAEAPTATASENGYSFIMDAAGGAIKKESAYADAQVDAEHFVLVVTSVDESAYEPKAPTVSRFHGSDIMFFSESIQKNVADRIAAFEAQ